MNWLPVAFLIDSFSILKLAGFNLQRLCYVIAYLTTALRLFLPLVPTYLPCLSWIPLVVVNSGFCSLGIAGFHLLAQADPIKRAFHLGSMRCSGKLRVTRSH